MPRSSRPSGQSGFSLVELMVAMAVTLIVTGAVYGLMAGGNNAFRREPELTDRQQNVRVAMELIQKDIATAGVNLGPFFQSFGQNLNAAGRITGPSGQVADHLEIYGNDGTCPDAPAGLPATSGVNFNAIGHIPNCYSEDAMVAVLYTNGGAKWGLGHEIHSNSTKINFPGGKQPGGSTIDGPDQLDSYVEDDKALCGFDGCSGVPNSLSAITILRYEIAPDLVDGVPSLYRSTTGGRNPLDDGKYVEPTDAQKLIDGHWQLIARGIEDLQVQYRNGTNRNGTGWDDDPGAVNCGGDCKLPTEAEYNRGVREVRVTVSARAEGQGLQGQTTSAAAGAGSRASAVRGSATTVTSVKALQNYLAAAGPTGACLTCPVWR